MNYGYPQQPQKKGMGVGTILLIVFGVFAVGTLGTCGACIAIGASGARQASSASASARETPEESASTQYEAVPAGRLIDDYEGNEIRGDNNWKNHAVEVSGVVRSVDKGPLGGLYIVIADPSKRVSFHNVHANLKDSENARASALNKGDTVTVRGRVLGYTVGSVSVRDAVIR